MVCGLGVEGGVWWNEGEYSAAGAAQTRYRINDAVGRGVVGRGWRCGVVKSSSEAPQSTLHPTYAAYSSMDERQTSYSVHDMARLTRWRSFLRTLPSCLNFVMVPGVADDDGGGGGGGVRAGSGGSGDR